MFRDEGVGIKLQAVVPAVGPLVAIPLHAVIRPWVKRRRLRKYLARTTPAAN